MSTAASTTTVMVPSVPVPPRAHRITVDEYERIILSGALKDPDRVELVNGYMVDKMAKSPQHGYSTRKAIDALAPIIGPGWTWRSEQPVRIPDYDEPEPDVAIVRGTTEDYAYRVPGPGDVELLIEVSLTSLDQDRGEKQLAYARGRIPVYWIINLVHRQVEVFSNPGPDGYGPSKVYGEGQSVPVVIGGQTLGAIAVNDILPPPVAGDGM
jgi:Uma2 family endonuclease